MGVGSQCHAQAALLEVSGHVSQSKGVQNTLPPLGSTPDCSKSPYQLHYPSFLAMMNMAL